MEHSLSTALTILWRKMTQAKTMADCDADLFDIMDTLILSEKIDEEFKRLVSSKH